MIISAFQLPLSRADKSEVVQAVETCGRCSTDNDFIALLNSDVKEHLGWLYSLYVSSGMTDKMSKEVGVSLEPVLNVENSVNVLLLNGHGVNYKWHTDMYAYTAITFITDHMNGGALVLRYNDMRVSFRPVSGTSVVFDGEKVMHSVEPLADHENRVVIAMSYVHAGLLNPYIYGNRAAS